MTVILATHDESISTRALERRIRPPRRPGRRAELGTPPPARFRRSPRARPRAAPRATSSNLLEQRGAKRRLRLVKNARSRFAECRLMSLDDDHSLTLRQLAERSTPPRKMRARSAMSRVIAAASEVRGDQESGPAPP